MVLTKEEKRAFEKAEKKWKKPFSRKDNPERFYRAEKLHKKGMAKGKIYELPSNFEFDPDKVLRKKPFPILKLNKDQFGYGLLLPKYESQRNKKGEFTHIEQIDSPVLINSDLNLIEINKRFEENYKIKFKEIPSELELRWSLKSIKNFLTEQYNKIDGIKLFFKIRRLYQKFLYFHNDIWYSIHSLWDMGTYFFILFKAYPIFELRGMQGTAKTKIMSISNGLTFNASQEIMVNPSESSLFRETHLKRITKYIDEAEKLFQIFKGKMIPDDRVTFINQSYFHKGGVPRQEKIGNKFVTVYYQAYSPTMIGSINGLYGATLNRSIVHITTKNPPKDKRGDLEPDTEDIIFSEIRNELYIFALQNWKEIETIYNNLENKTEMKSRDFQIWKPLLSMAKFLDEDLYNEIKENAERLTKVKEDSIAENSTEYHILVTVGKLIKENRYYRNCILIKDIYNDYPIPDYKPSHKSIGRILDGVGFMENKKRTDEGYGYEIFKELYQNIVSTLNPFILSSFSSFSSFLHIKEEKIMNKNELNDKKMNKKNELNEDNEDNERGIDKKEVKLSDNDLLAFIKEKGKKGYPSDKFAEKYGDDNIKRLLKKGDIVEMPKGYLRILE